jgi:hypothetical protein
VGKSAAETTAVRRDLARDHSEINALTQGLYTRIAIAEHRRLQALLRQARRLVQDIE